jgi:2-dehydro-3-deoxyphosphooctonate aldolase (KDO 8-P synthase)
MIPLSFGQPGGPLLVIAGPCVIESAELCLTVAEQVKSICHRLDMPYVFKASFDKANRSSSASFRGPGLTDGLVVLERVRREAGVPVLTDVHDPAQAPVAAKVVDVLQVPAFLARQTDLLVACGRTGKPVNVKKGQFMSPQEMKLAIEKVRSGAALAQPNFDSESRASDAAILLTERGTFFGYNRLVNDFTAIPIMQGFGVPVIFDITHSTQQPAGLGDSSGGNPQFSPMLACAAVAAGADGLFLECHPDPKAARSDAATMMHLDDVEPLLTRCRQLAELRRTWK